MSLDGRDYMRRDPPPYDWSPIVFGSIIGAIVGAVVTAAMLWS